MIVMRVLFEGNLFFPAFQPPANRHFPLEAGNEGFAVFAHHSSRVAFVEDSNAGLLIQSLLSSFTKSGLSFVHTWGSARRLVPAVLRTSLTDAARCEDMLH